ncbi:MAG: TIGR03936 family radical SAM-associated protein, partial [Nitrospinota bacterium]
MRRSSFTIAVEAATERLRGTINKKVSNKEVKDVIALLIQNNWCRIKLYFMIGLPTETDFDVEQIGQLAKELAQVEVNNKRLTGITISIGNFVPKAHTPFQWSSFDSIENLKRKQAIILDSVKRMKKINVKFHNVYTSRLEALFARGDRRLSDAIESAFEDGLRFDAWSEKFDRLKWDEVFNRLSIDASFYINRQIAKEATLPWQHLDIMVEHKRLLKEASLAEQDKISMDCRTGSCLACGIDPNHCSDYKKSFNSKVIPYQKEDKIVKGTGLYKYRFTYQKRGLIRFISYIQTTLLFKRAFRQAKLPLAFRQGFARNLKISFDDALPLGYESLNEKFDLSLTENIPVDHLLKLISKSLPENLSVTDIKLLPAGAKSIQVATKSNHYKVVIKELINKEDFVRKINEYNLAPKLVVSRRRKEKIESFDLKESVSELLVDFDSFIITNGRSELSFNYFLNKKSRPKATVSDIVCHLFNRKIRTRVTKLGN